MKTLIAMRCTQEQWESIKDLIPKEIRLFSMDEFKINHYLVLFNDNTITNGTVPCKESKQIHETFDAKIFLEACGIETFTVTKKQIENAKDLKELFPNVFMSEEEKLIAEAKKRGYKEGVWVKSINNEICFLIKNSRFDYIKQGIYLRIDKVLIFDNGEWAQIVTVTPV